MSARANKGPAGATVSKFLAPHFEFPASGEEPRRTIALCVASRRARAVWGRKFGCLAEDAAARARQMRFLAGRGFSAEVIRRVVSGEDDG